MASRHKDLLAELQFAEVSLQAMQSKFCNLNTPAHIASAFFICTVW